MQWTQLGAVRMIWIIHQIDFYIDGIHNSAFWGHESTLSRNILHELDYSISYTAYRLPSNCAYFSTVQ